MPSVPRQLVEMPAKNDSGRNSSNARHVGVFFGFVSAYQQNDVNGTTRRLSGLGQRRQYGLFVLQIFLIGAPPNAGGPDIPRRAIANPPLSYSFMSYNWKKRKATFVSTNDQLKFVGF
jgi:hypothetical protein